MFGEPNPLAVSLPLPHLAAHIRELTTRFDIGVKKVQTVFDSGVRNTPGLHPIIQGPPITHEGEYLVWLHEIGHVKSHGPKSWWEFTSNILDYEAQAWEWALNNTLVEPSPQGWTFVHYGLSNYSRTQPRSIPRTPRFMELFTQAEERRDRTLNLRRLDPIWSRR